MAGSGGRGGSGGGAACVPTGSAGKQRVDSAHFRHGQAGPGGGGAIMPCAAAPCHAVGGMAPPGNPLTLQDTARALREPDFVCRPGLRQYQARHSGQAGGQRVCSRS